MTLESIILYGFAGLSLVLSLYIALTRNVLYAAIALIGAFLGVAGIFMMLGASFVAISQVLVYVGGILILIVFGIMLTNRLRGQKVLSTVYNKFWALMIAAGLFIVFVKGIFQANFSSLSWIKEAKPALPTPLEKFGMRLMTDYVVGFELIGILLLLALIGAVKMAAKSGKEERDAH